MSKRRSNGAREAERKWRNYVQCTGCGRYQVEGSSKWEGYGPTGPQDVNSVGYMRCKEAKCKEVQTAVQKAASAAVQKAAKAGK